MFSHYTVSACNDLFPYENSLHDTLVYISRNLSHVHTLVSPLRQGHIRVYLLYFSIGTYTHRIITARKEKGRRRHLFHQIEPNWPLPYSTVPVPRLREARLSGWVPLLQYMRKYGTMPIAQNRTGNGSIQLWRRFTFPIFLLFIYAYTLAELLTEISSFPSYCTSSLILPPSYFKLFFYILFKSLKVLLGRIRICRYLSVSKENNTDKYKASVSQVSL